MRRVVLGILLVTSLFCVQQASAQVSIGVGVGPRFGVGGMGYGRPMGRRQQKPKDQPKFTPIVHLSFGYGFPNLDVYQMASLFNYSRGTSTQTGPITGAIDIQYSPTASAGIMVTHGQVSAPYYDYNNPSGPPVMYGSLDNWSIMANFVRYMPASPSFSGYFRTAIGVNIWNQNYTDGSGNKLAFDQPSLLAYQIGIGGKLKITKNSSLFMEAGYGKYILHGGLSFKL